MNLQTKYRVVIIGHGNVGQALGRALQANPYVDLCAVVTRNRDHYNRWSLPLCSWSEIPPVADLYIIAVNDNAITEVREILKQKNIKGIVVHTCGVASMDLLMPVNEGIGVFYPLQSFSKTANNQVNNTPFLLEASDEETMEKLWDIAGCISDQRFKISSSQREKIHLAAVFANNFTNHLMARSYDILRQEDIPFTILKHLVIENTRDLFALEGSPGKRQSGPAVRGDNKSIEKHMLMLEEDTQLRELYQTITNSIIKYHNGKF